MSIARYLLVHTIRATFVYCIIKSWLSKSPFFCARWHLLLVYFLSKRADQDQRLSDSKKLDKRIIQCIILIPFIFNLFFHFKRNFAVKTYFQFPSDGKNDPPRVTITQKSYFPYFRFKAITDTNVSLDAYHCNFLANDGGPCNFFVFFTACETWKVL